MRLKKRLQASASRCEEDEMDSHRVVASFAVEAGVLHRNVPIIRRQIATSELYEVRCMALRISSHPLRATNELRKRHDRNRAGGVGAIWEYRFQGAMRFNGVDNFNGEFSTPIGLVPGDRNRTRLDGGSNRRGGTESICEAREPIDEDPERDKGGGTAGIRRGCIFDMETRSRPVRIVWQIRPRQNATTD